MNGEIVQVSGSVVRRQVRIGSFRLLNASRGKDDRKKQED